MRRIIITRWFVFVCCLLLTHISLNSAYATEQNLWYLGYRVSPTDRPWLADDYVKMIKALKEIKKDKPEALPRRGGEFSGDLYNRMISQENFRPQLSIYTPVVLRREEAFSILQSLKEIMKLYFDFKATKQEYGAEALGLMAYSVRQQAVLFTITVEFWMSLTPKEQKNPQRVQGLNASKEAAAALTLSALDYLNLSKQFNENHLIVYAYEISDSIGDLYVHLRDADKVKIKQKVHELSQSHPVADVRDALERLDNILSAFNT